MIKLKKRKKKIHLKNGIEGKLLFVSTTFKLSSKIIPRKHIKNPTSNLGRWLLLLMLAQIVWFGLNCDVITSPNVVTPSIKLMRGIDMFRQELKNILYFIVIEYHRNKQFFLWTNNFCFFLKK